MSDELAKLDATAQADFVRRGEASPLDLVQAAIKRIERLNPKLNAVIYRSFERAMAQGRTGPPGGPFRGVPLLLKDLGGRRTSRRPREALHMPGSSARACFHTRNRTCGWLGYPAA